MTQTATKCLQFQIEYGRRCPDVTREFLILRIGRFRFTAFFVCSDERIIERWYGDGRVIECLARSFRRLSSQLVCRAKLFFTRRRPRRAVEPVEKWHGHVEVPLLHETRFVMPTMVLTQFGDDAKARDRVVERQVIRQMQPLVGQEKHHRCDGDEHGDVRRDVQFENDRDGQHERHKDEHDSVSGHQDKPPLALAFYGHVAIGEDDVMVKFVAYVQKSEQRQTTMQDALVRSPFEAKRREERDRNREQFDGSKLIRLNTNDRDDEHAQADRCGDGQVHRRVVTRRQTRHDLRATIRPRFVTLETALVHHEHHDDDTFCKCRMQAKRRGKPAISGVGLTLVALEKSSDGFANLGDDRVDDHDADKEGDEGQFVGCAKGQHRSVVFSLPSRASSWRIVVYCSPIASVQTTERAGRTR